MSPAVTISFATEFQSSYWRVRQKDKPDRLACFPYHAMNEEEVHNHTPKCRGTIGVEVSGLTCDLDKCVVRGEHVLTLKANDDDEWTAPPQTAPIAAFVEKKTNGTLVFSISDKNANLFTFPQTEYNHAAYRVQILELQQDGSWTCLAECQSDPYRIIFKRTTEFEYPPDTPHQKITTLAVDTPVPQERIERQVAAIPTRSTQRQLQHELPADAPPKHSKELQRAKRQRRQQEQSDPAPADVRRSEGMTAHINKDYVNNDDSTGSYVNNDDSTGSYDDSTGIVSAVSVPRDTFDSLRDVMSKLNHLVSVCESRLQSL